MLSNGAVDLVLDFKSRGLIKHVAASSHTAAALLKAMDHPAVEAVQWPFNFVMYEDAREILSKCKAQDTGFVAMKPFGGGMFPNAGPCIRFLMQYPEIVSDPGFEKIEEVEEVVALAESYEGLSDEDQQQMQNLRGELGKRFCRRCGYCSPCPHGVEIIGLMTVPSFIKRLPPERVFTESRSKTIATVDNCTDCEECEEKCPYELPIRETMRMEAKNYQNIQSARA